MVITFAFSFALLVLLQCELNEDGNPDWHDPWRALFIVLNMGLYTYTDETAQSLNRNWLILAMYQLFMFLVQIVLLSLNLKTKKSNMIN